VRVYTNAQHLSAAEWYSQNLVAQGTPVPFVVDGFTGVLDNRVAYINAANISASKAFYTNIYVIAYNLNASPQTVNIFNQIVTNWKFNKNILDNEGAAEGEKTKDRLRRDTQRLEQINVIRNALESYKNRTGSYPDLKAGTFDAGRVISTWPTWQSVLGNALGVALPVDPLNMMATDFYPGGNPNPSVPRQYDCKNDYEGSFCQNVCSRDADGLALTGCRIDQQCVTNETAAYCSVIAPGFDALTGWNQETKQLYFKEKTGGIYPEGGYNTYGPLISSADKYKDDAFVYQYSTLDGGKTYSFNYRLEYQSFCLERYADGSCKTLSDTRCSANSCFLEAVGANGTCIDSGTSPYSGKACEAGSAQGEACTEDANCPGSACVSVTRPDYRGKYCFAGIMVNSCGNGLLQTDAGEQCEFAKSEGVFCDERYGSQTWYNEANISNKCTTSCQLVDTATTGELPLKYDPQKPGLSCGGFCGDNQVQYEFNEQCDQGVAGGPIDLPIFGGSGGISADSQYQCSPPQALTSVDGTKLADGVTNTLSDHWKLDQVSGSTALNAVVYDPVHDGSVQNGTDADWVYGRTGGSLNQNDHGFKFNGTNTYVTTPVSVYPTPNTSTTWSAWVYPEAVNLNYRQHILSSDNGGFDRSVVIEQGTGTFGVFIGSGIWLAAPVDLNRWQHIAVSYTSEGKVYFYKNGVEYFDPSINVSFDEAPDNFNFGRSNYNGGTDYFNGVLDEVKIYNRNLSSTEINQVYRGSVGGCKSYGGYCGDGQVQTGDGEQCDITSFIPPSPRRSVDQLSNAGFESGHEVWLPVGLNGVETQPEVSGLDGKLLDTSRYTRQILVGEADKLLIKSGARSYQFIPKENGVGIGQQVSYQPSNDVANPTTVTVKVDMSSNSSNYTLVAKARLYSYDFVTKTLNKFKKAGDANSPYDYLEATLRSIDGDSASILDVYRTYQAQLTIPAQYDGALNSATIIAIVFTTPNGESFPVTAGGNKISPQYYIDNLVVDSTFRLNYSCTTVKGRLCQFSGGYCGDGVLQKDKGEVCDNGAANGTDTSVDGVLCNKYCSMPFCGDGKKGYKVDVSGKLKVELCDYSDLTDPNHDKCNYDCSKLEAGAYCSVDSDCSSNSCVKGRCAYKLGESGCRVGDANSCPDGAVCDPQTSICRPRTDLYLQYRFDANGLPLQADNSSKLTCPKLTTKTVVSSNNIPIKILKDLCTGLEFYGNDTPQNIKSKFYQAGCGADGFEIPTVKQLYALISPTAYTGDSDNSTSMIPNNLIQACSLGGQVAGTTLGGKDTCLESTDDRYLYWTKTPYGNENVCSINPSITCTTTNDCSPVGGPDSGSCISKYYYAVDLRNGTVDVVNSDSQLNTRCVNNSLCGNGVIEADEQCEFDPRGLEAGISVNSCESNREAQKVAPYTGGKVHCDIKTCRLRFDNCVIAAGPGQSCSNICQNALPENSTTPLGETVKSFGLNLTENYPSLSSQNNSDTNRRPKLNPAGSDDVCSGEGKYCYLADGKAVFDLKDNSSTGYAVADDLRITDASEADVCIETNLTATQGDYSLTDKPVAPACPYGFAVSDTINYNNDSNLIYNTGNAKILNQKAQRTLCNCTYTPSLHQVVSGTTGDIAQLAEINAASILVDTAERNRLEASAASDFQNAQTAVTALFNLASLTNKQPAIDLQNRLNALAETTVFETETLGSTSSARYSRWQFDEGSGRTGRNTGLGRLNLELGVGRDATITCSGFGCTQNVTWPDGKWGTNHPSGPAGATVDHIRSSIHLDGFNDYIFTDARAIDPARGTVSLWINAETFDNKVCSNNPEQVCSVAEDCGAGTCDVHDQTLFEYYPGTSSAIELKINSAKQATLTLPSCTATTTDLSWDVGTWHNFAFTYSGTSTVLYFDGVSKASATGCTALSAAVLPKINEKITMGARIDDLGLGTRANFFKGSLDEVRIYDSVFYQTKINLLQEAVNNDSDIANDTLTLALAPSVQQVVVNSIKNLTVSSNLAKAGISLYNLFSAFPASATQGGQEAGVTENILKWVYLKVSSLFNNK